MGHGFTLRSNAKAKAGLKALLGIGMPGRVLAAGNGIIVPLGGLGNATGLICFGWPIIVQSPIHHQTFHSEPAPLVREVQRVVFGWLFEHALV